MTRAMVDGARYARAEDGQGGWVTVVIPVVALCASAFTRARAGRAAVVVACNRPAGHRGAHSVEGNL